MRKKIVAGNLKMNLNANQVTKLVGEINQKTENLNIPENIKIGICPPSVYIGQAISMVSGHLANTIGIGGQDCSYTESGAFTGQVSAEMLADIGCKYVIVGHSERRQYFNEDDVQIHEKAKIALEKGLEVIYCCGENLEQRKANQHLVIVEQQIKTALSAFSEEQMKNIIIAYEPVWAIGTGETASPEQANEIHAHIRGWLKGQFGEEIAQNMTILYGGSVKPANATDIFAQPDVDGGLIGGASLKSESFMAIVEAIL